MKKKIWKMLKRKYKTEKGIQNSIIEGTKIALVLFGTIIFLLFMIVVKGKLGI
jgi:hypothetical protein